MGAAVASQLRSSRGLSSRYRRPAVGRVRSKMCFTSGRIRETPTVNDWVCRGTLFDSRLKDVAERKEPKIVRGGRRGTVQLEIE